MPNDVTTVCTVTGPDAEVDALIVKHVRPSLRGANEGDEVFDFDTVIPMPRAIRNTIRPRGDKSRKAGAPIADVCDLHVDLYARALVSHWRASHIYDRSEWLPAHVTTWEDVLAWYDRTRPAVAFWAKRALRAAAETGYPYGYLWRDANWGTSRNSYAFERRDRLVGRLVFRFITAWVFPRPIFDALAKMWPLLTFDTESIVQQDEQLVGHFRGPERRVDEVLRTRERYIRVYGFEPYADEGDDAGLLQEEPARI
jgi:hypothetical protein